MVKLPCFSLRTEIFWSCELALLGCFQVSLSVRKQNDGALSSMMHQEKAKLWRWVYASELGFT
jgi:hypothetical protein